MKAIRFAVLLLPLLATAGCGSYGGGATNSSSSAPVLFIYVVGQNSQSIFGFKQDSTNAITTLTIPTTGTTLQPKAVLVHPSKNFAYVANFGSNNVTKYSRNLTTGQLTPLGSVPPTPVGTGPIALATDSKGQFLYVLNQGSVSVPASISAFSIDANRGLLTELAGSPFATQPNPVAFAVSQSSGFLYVANGTQHNVSGFAIGADGTLSAVAGSPFDTGAGTNASWVAVDPKGRFVYAADFANNAIVGFAIQSGGVLSAVSGSPFPCGGIQPTGLSIDATGAFLYVANQGSNSISGLGIASSGSLSIVSGSPFPSGGAQTTYVTVDATNKFVYDTNSGGNNVGASSINLTTGALTQLTGSPIAVGTVPAWIATSN
ncbi:MAG TPA: beta-propeller fold lactonase family protein [Candidatus Angelobacter sp.]|nr:beta-propeller fold lactonase family protein [Candidatus Angelobacter sp.]